MFDVATMEDPAGLVDTAGHMIDDAAKTAKLGEEAADIGKDVGDATKDFEGAGRAEEGTSVASGLGGQTSSMNIERIINKGEKLDDLTNELKVRTFETGNEHAIVKLSAGTRAIVSGGDGGIRFNKDVQRVFVHTHPYDRLSGPSEADFKMLEAYGQKSSWLISGEYSGKF